MIILLLTKLCEYKYKSNYTHYRLYVVGMRKNALE